ncbi:hypothetical protein [Acidovorax sp. RAC01]|uniref:hypothetical protein n=1 Tax=Acidovorax sp. RAC01 TaxID=1842533 RepID=UPI00083E7AA3|nr:hypothetical protein [Acidovorax sp. RAC01]AOG22939.1 putative membrane protein [Acidovorax sp. RAC01]
MNPLLIAAAVGLALVGLVHSVLGEIMVFRGLRTQGVRAQHRRHDVDATRSSVPTWALALPRAQLGIVWASWHLVTLLGWALAALLWRLGTAPSDAALAAWVADAAGLATLAGGMLVLYATRGRHPGWTALLVVAALVWWR